LPFLKLICIDYANLIELLPQKPVHASSEIF